MDDVYTCCMCGVTDVSDPDGGYEPSLITIECPIQSRGWLKRSGKLCEGCLQKIGERMTPETTTRSWD